MSAHKHTPGPWKVGQPYGCSIYDNNGKRVAKCFEVWTSPLRPLTECKANGRLIAAAPELLEALNKLTSFVVTDVVESCNGNKCREPWCAGCFGEEVAEQTIREAQEALDAARAAIAKATGEPA